MTPPEYLALKVFPGQDLHERICRLVEQEEMYPTYIAAVSGDLTVARVKFAGSSDVVTLEGKFNIVSLTGVMQEVKSPLQLVIADATGKILAGELCAGCQTGESVEVVFCVIPIMTYVPLKDAAVAKTAPVVVPKASRTTPKSTPQPAPNPTTTSGGFILHTDGASKGNPGPAGIGIALFRDNDLQNPVFAFGEFIGRTTNNVAEYRALIRGLQEALLRGVERIEVRTDSQLMAQQVSGKYKVNAEQIILLHAEAVQLLSRFAFARVVYIPREMNSLADKLANQGVAQGK